MLSQHCRKRSGLALTSHFLRVCNYHSYPLDNEVPIIKNNRSSVKKQIKKTEGQWQEDFSAMKKKFDISTCFPGYEESFENAKTHTAPVPEMTKLENGLTVVSIKTPDMTMASLAFLINAGSADEVQCRDDAINTGGITSILECMAFGATVGSESEGGETETETVSCKLNRIGAIDQVTTNRENICFFVDVVRDSAERGLELLADAVLRPATTPESVTAAVEDLTFRNDYMMADVMSRDGMSMAAYEGSSLGNFHFPKNMLQMGLHTPEKITQFRQSILYGNNCVLAAAGMEHDELVTMAKKYFDTNNLPTTSLTAAPKKSPAKYTGGLYVEQREMQEPFVKLAIGYEVGGYKSESLYTMCVLEKLLGGGSSFSAGGPGKGMYTRLYLDVLNRHHWIESAQGFVVPHENNGLLGIDASCQGENIQYLYQVVLDQFLRLATEEVTPLELSRAKNMLRSQLMMQLESRIVVCEDIARQYATYGKRDLPEVTCEKIESVTAADIQHLVKTMIMQPPSVVCIGEDVSNLPTYEQLREFTMKKTMEAINKSPKQ